MTWTIIEPETALERQAVYALYPTCDSRVFDYVEGVLDGSIDACDAIVLACRRMLRELCMVQDAGCRWTFDPELASKPIRFVEKFMRPTGDYDRMELMPWQCWFYANLFGFVDRKTGERKYLQALLIVGSGNGKTPLVAGAALYQASQEGRRNAEIDILANSRNQAGTLLNDCRSMVAASPALSTRFLGLKGRVEYYREGVKSRGRGAVPDAVIQTLSANARNLDGLRPTTAAFDEVHQMAEYDLIEQMRRSLDKTFNGLLLMFSTMGTVLDGPLMSEYRSAQQMLRGNGNSAVNERRLAVIYELNEKLDPADYQHWGQANPSLGKLLDLEKMRLRFAEGQTNPARLLDFYTKSLNLFTKVHSLSYMSHELIERNQDSIDLEAIRGREAFGGFDLSTSYDHTGAALLVPLDDGRIVVLFHCFVPRRVAEVNHEHLDYYACAMGGELTIIDGDYIDQSHILHWFEKMAETFDIRCIGYDPANATLLVRSLSSYRGENKPVFACDPVRQGALTLNDPMKRLKEFFSDGRVIFNRSRLFEWYLNNVKLRKDYATRDNENWVPVKLDKYSKIDVFMAFLDAFTAWMRRCPAPGAESHGNCGVEYIDLTDMPGPEPEPGGLAGSGENELWGWL